MYACISGKNVIFSIREDRINGCLCLESRRMKFSYRGKLEERRNLFAGKPSVTLQKDEFQAVNSLTICCTRAPSARPFVSLIAKCFVLVRPNFHRSSNALCPAALCYPTGPITPLQSQSLPFARESHQRDL